MRISNAWIMTSLTALVILTGSCKTAKKIAGSGTAQSVINKQLDVQADEIREKLQDVVVERTAEGIIVGFNSKLLFEYDKSALTLVAEKILNDLLIILDKYPDTDIDIQGYTDNFGTKEYNQGLSERRATAVFDFIKAKNIYNQRVKSVKGYGETNPKYPNDTEENRALNRRVNFLITPNEKMKAEAEKATVQR